jgi:hypothetical protein
MTWWQSRRCSHDSVGGAGEGERDELGALGKLLGKLL